MVRIICDRCGQDFGSDMNADVGYIAWNFRHGTNGDLALDNEFEGCHFCTDCMGAIRDFVLGKGKTAQAEVVQDAEPEPGQVREPETEPESGREPEPGQKTNPENSSGSGKKKRKIVDIGKIMALHNAGWSSKAIAEEMHTTQKAVSSAIWRYKNKQAGAVGK